MGSSSSAVRLRRTAAAAATATNHPVRRLGRFMAGAAWRTSPDQNRAGTNTQAGMWPGSSPQYTTNLKHEQKQISRTVPLNAGSTETHHYCSSNSSGGQPSGESDGTLHRSSSKDQLNDMSKPWLDWGNTWGEDEADSSESLDAEPDVVLDASDCAVQ